MKYVSIDGLIYCIPISVANELERCHSDCCGTCNDETLLEINECIARIKDSYAPISDWWDNYMTIQKEEKILPF